MHLNNRSDVEDVFQGVFLKYALHKTVFSSHAHEKAWLICVSMLHSMPKDDAQFTGPGGGHGHAHQNGH